SQQGSKLVGTGAIGGARQGMSVAQSGDGSTAVVGGYADDGLKGAVWVFTRANGIWSQQGNKLVGAGAVNGVLGSFQGYSVSVSSNGNTVVVGGYPDNDFTGAAWTYTRTNGLWSQSGGKLVGTGASGNAEQGVSVSLSSDGNTVLVGGFADDTLKGAAWVFTRFVSGIQETALNAPVQFVLRQNYPNPFNPATTIAYDLPVPAFVRLSVFDILGREISVLVSERIEAGAHAVRFDGSDLASGVYFYRLQAGESVTTKRLILMR
ncbi:MAG TPA: T9SS type A sorting domain-containing protein, partial [Bacteroidota bacterium]|nr:T9SS type A sorting domain-containing protein [Bacteroidota bacterium]